MCGVFGMISKEPIGELLLHGMSLLQHRGQDATGIFTYHPETRQQTLYKDLGLVKQVLSPSYFQIPPAHWGIGHLRYATVGAGHVGDIQPHTIKRGDVTIAMAHNGNIVNYVPLKSQLLSNNVQLNTTCDTEIILNIFAEKIPEEGCGFDAICDGVEEVFTHVFGSYSILILITGVGMVAFRDPWGFRPLLFGKTQDSRSYVFTSEMGPVSSLDVEEMMDVEPGEVIFIDEWLGLHRRQIKEHLHTHCSFEFNYFAKPNAVIEKKEVYRVRAQLGLALAKAVKERGLAIDVVVPIPTTAVPSALALGHALEIPIEEGFIKQNYTGRTFIMPTQSSRKKAVSEKIATVGSVFAGKNVLLVDDSIVRGNVSRHAVELARKAGAKSVFFASTYPPVYYPCFYGIDFPQQEELIAYGRSDEEIAQEIGANEVIYNTLDDFKKAIGIDDLCTACLTGNYPTKIEGAEQLQCMRQMHLQQRELSCKS